MSLCILNTPVILSVMTVFYKIGFKNPRPKNKWPPLSEFSTGAPDFKYHSIQSISESPIKNFKNTQALAIKYAHHVDFADFRLMIYIILYMIYVYSGAILCILRYLTS